MRHVSTKSKLVHGHKSTQNMFAHEHISMQGMLVCEHISTKDTWACKHARTVGTKAYKARWHINTQDTLAQDTLAHVSTFNCIYWQNKSISTGFFSNVETKILCKILQSYKVIKSSNLLKGKTVHISMWATKVY